MEDSKDIILIFEMTTLLPLNELVKVPSTFVIID